MSFLPFLLNILNIDVTGTVDAATDGAASETMEQIKTGVDAWFSGVTDKLRAWFKEQAYGAMDISLVVMGICLAGIAIVLATSSEIASVSEAATSVAASADQYRKETNKPNSEQTVTRKAKRIGKKK